MKLTWILPCAALLLANPLGCLGADQTTPFGGSKAKPRTGARATDPFAPPQRFEVTNETSAGDAPAPAASTVEDPQGKAEREARWQKAKDDVARRKAQRNAAAAKSAQETGAALAAANASVPTFITLDGERVPKTNIVLVCGDVLSVSEGGLVLKKVVLGRFSREDAEVRGGAIQPPSYSECIGCWDHLEPLERIYVEGGTAFDGDRVEIEALPGRGAQASFTYTTVQGARSKIRRFIALPSELRIGRKKGK